MFGPFELAIGLRYLRAKRRNRFISVISLISMLGIGVGVMALIVVLSVMNGFATELRTRILSMTAHAQVTGSAGRIADWPELRARLAATEGLIGSAPFVQGEGMLSVGGRMSGLLVRGVDPALEPAVSDLDEHMVVGALDALKPGEFGIVVGQELAWALGVGLGDKVVLMISQGNVTPAGFVPRLRRFTVVGVFEVGMYEYDRSLAVLHLEDAALLYGLDGGVGGVRLELADMFEAPRVAQGLGAALGPEYRVSDWTQQHVNFFRAIATEKRVMGVILFLIVMVAAINIISTLVMVVTEKQADIAILRTLGASPGSVMTVFMVQGTLIGAVGTLLGTVAGVLLSLNVETIVRGLESLAGVEFLPADVYYINSLPSELHLSDVSLIAGVAFTMSFLLFRMGLPPFGYGGAVLAAIGFITPLLARLFGAPGAQFNLFPLSQGGSLSCVSRFGMLLKELSRALSLFPTMGRVGPIGGLKFSHAFTIGRIFIWRQSGEPLLKTLH